MALAWLPSSMASERFVASRALRIKVAQGPRLQLLRSLADCIPSASRKQPSTGFADLVHELPIMKCGLTPEGLVAMQIDNWALQRFRLTVSAIAAAVVVAASQWDQANAGGASGRHDRLVAVPAANAVRIDGRLDDWDLSGAIESVYDPALVDRFAATLAAMYDREAIYLAAHVVDDTPLVNLHDPRVEPDKAWDGDAIQVRLATDPAMPYPLTASTFGAQQGEPFSKEPRIVHLTFWHFTDRNQPCLSLQRGMDYHGNTVMFGNDAPLAFRKDADGKGYIMEARLPWTLLGVRGKPPGGGDRLAMTVQWLWGNPQGTKNVLTFCDIVRGTGFHFQTAENWGLVELSSAGKLGPARRAPSPAQLETPLTMTLPSLDPEARQVSAAVFNSAGELVRTLPVITSPSPVGNRPWSIPWDGLNHDGQPLPAGSYTVQYLTHRGIGFFEAGNFYPDFILWLLDGNRQYVSFIDPKGLRNLEGPEDPKIRFHVTIKDLERQLGDPAVVLNSFIVSSTRVPEVAWWDDGMTKEEFEARNVLFQREDRATYIEKLLVKMKGGG